VESKACHGFFSEPVVSTIYFRVFIAEVVPLLNGIISEELERNGFRQFLTHLSLLKMFMDLALIFTIKQLTIMPLLTNFQIQGRWIGINGKGGLQMMIL
jgi:hypothetical protein